jgi:hypothetical protein
LINHGTVGPRVWKVYTRRGRKVTTVWWGDVVKDRWACNHFVLNKRRMSVVMIVILDCKIFF